jgi:hypothetical protein
MVYRKVLNYIFYTGGGLLFATPPKPVPGFKWKLQTFFYIYKCIADVHLIFYTFVFDYFQFFAFPLFKWNFYVRLEGIPNSYQQLLLNLWVDSNENFRHSSTLEMYTYTNAIWDLIIFNCFGFPYWKMDSVIPYLRGSPSLIHYPSLTCEWISMKHV